MSGNEFPRALRLKRRRLIRPLFDGKQKDVGSVTVGVLHLRYRVVPRSEAGADIPFQVGFALVRRSRNSVERNRIRRVMKETFRQHQTGLRALFDSSTECLTMMILFRGRDGSAAEGIRRDMPVALRQLVGRLSPDQ